MIEDDFSAADTEGEMLAVTPRLLEFNGDSIVTTCKLLSDPRVTMAALGASLSYF